MTNKTHTRGFTLIELLVVIAIIGILSSVVLASLNSARAKGADASVKSNLANIRAQAELYYDNQNPNSYGSGSHTLGTCSQTANTLFFDTVVYNAITSAKTSAGVSNTDRCYSSSGGYLVSVPLKTDATYSWCVDSQGNSRRVTTASVSGAITACPAGA